PNSATARELRREFRAASTSSSFPAVATRKSLFELELSTATERSQQCPRRSGVALLPGTTARIWQFPPPRTTKPFGCPVSVQDASFARLASSLHARAHCASVHSESP